MPISINTLKTGDVVYDVRKARAGNTLVRRTAVYSVRIISVDIEKGCVDAQWNCNPTKTYRSRLGKLPWRRTKPKQL